jgi:hypothetical protein
MDTGNTSTTEKLNMLGAALLTASAAHGLLCLATLPGLIEAPHAGLIGGAGKALGILWTIAGVVGGAFVALRSLSVFQGKDFAKARFAAIGTLVLPAVGLTGGVTAFALVPIGAAAWWLLRQPSWQAGFANFGAEPIDETQPVAEMETEEEPEVEEPALR